MQLFLIFFLLCRFINADPSGFSGGLNFYAYADGNPVSLIDPFGLGAVGEATGHSWISDIATGLGLDNSYAAQNSREEFLTGFVNLASFGLANDAAIALTQRDLNGNLMTSEEQGVAEFQAAMAIIPLLKVEGITAKLATELGEVAADQGAGLYAGRAGSFGDLNQIAEVGDNLTPHHMPQAALNFTSYEQGGAIMLPQSDHILTRTYGFRGALTAQQDAGLAFRSVLANDVRDLRSISGSQYNQGIQDLLQYYRQNFPQLMAKPSP